MISFFQTKKSFFPVLFLVLWPSVVLSDSDGDQDEVSFQILVELRGVKITETEYEASTLINLGQEYFLTVTPIVEGKPEVEVEETLGDGEIELEGRAYWKSRLDDPDPPMMGADGKYLPSDDGANISLTSVSFSRAGYWKVVYFGTLTFACLDEEGNAIKEGNGKNKTKEFDAESSLLFFTVAKVSPPSYKEKAWTMEDFDATEDGDVIWTCDEHEYRVTYVPEDLNGVSIYKSAYSSGSASSSSSVNLSPTSLTARSRSQWVGGYMSDVMAAQSASASGDEYGLGDAFLAVNSSGEGVVDAGNTLGTGDHNIRGGIVNGKNPIKSNDKRVFLTSLDRIEWESVETPKTANGQNLAYLGAQPEGSPLAGLAVFPEMDKPADKGGRLYDFVRINVRIAQAVPEGLEGNIHLAFLDPMNQCKTFHGDRVGRAINDNGACQQHPATLQITNEHGTAFYFSRQITNSRAGSNFIVAGHPRSETRDNIVIDMNDSDLKTPIVKDGDGSESIIQTDLLTVWRTLWCELDHMAMPGHDIQDVWRESDGTLRLRETYFATSEKGITWDDVAPENEPVTFDVRQQPPLPDISLLSTLLFQACIKVAEYGYNTEKVLPFKPNLNSDEVLYKHNNEYGKNYRSIPEATDTYWTHHVISAYEHDLDDHDNHTENGLNIINVVKNNGNSCGHTRGLNRGAAYVFYETLRDTIMTHCLCTGVCPPGYVDVDTAFGRLVAHEILHSFLGHHDPGNDESPTNQNIMRNGPYHTTTDCNLNVNQIRIIQSKSRPVPALF